MKSFYKSLLNNLLILLAIALLAQCTGLDSAPGGAPGGLQAGLGALDGPGAGGLGQNPAAPVSQPTEDGILRIRPQIVLARVILPPRSDLPNTEAPTHQAMAKVEKSNSRNLMAQWDFPESEYEEDHEDQGKWGTEVEIGDHAQEAEQVPGDFVDSQPYVWALQEGKPGPVTPYVAANDYGLANLKLYYTTPQGQECDTQFRFYACDKISDRVWLARPVHALCPVGTYSEPYIVNLQLVRPMTPDELGGRDCPPPKTHAMESAPATELEFKADAPAP